MYYRTMRRQWFHEILSEIIKSDEWELAYYLGSPNSTSPRLEGNEYSRCNVAVCIAYEEQKGRKQIAT